MGKSLGSAGMEILSLLKQRGEQYGQELVGNSRGVIKEGSVYVLLSRLEKQGRVTSRHEERQGGPGPRRRLFRITEQGESEMAEAIGRLEIEIERIKQRAGERLNPAHGGAR